MPATQNRDSIMTRNKNLVFHKTIQIHRIATGTKQQTKLRSPKKGFFLEPRYVGTCTFRTNKIDTHTHAISDTGLYSFVFVPDSLGQSSENQDLYKYISMPYSQSKKMPNSLQTFTNNHKFCQTSCLV